MARAGMRDSWRFARPEERGRDIGAGAPVGADGNVDRRAAFRHGGRHGGEQPLGADGDQQLAGEARRDLQLGDFAGRIGLLVEGDLQPVGRLGRGRRDIPAGVELVAGGRAGRVGASRSRGGSGPSRRSAKWKLRPSAAMSTVPVATASVKVTGS